MKKIFLSIKVIFHIVNIILVLLYIYPGSILGWIVYDNIRKQPNLTSDFVIFSSNHVYAFVFLSLLGLLSYYKNRAKQLFLYLFSASIILEISHFFIPERSFQYQDLFGNLLGVLLIFIIFNLYKLFRKN
jgi:hypothetical protein|tara:strand:- start:356 stop:745 length:390 start_codon:yes stop_codon:yes gene_type:complete